jgi:class 3 adenylate cyclase
MTTICPCCGVHTREGLRFCVQCGVSLVNACPACGTAPEPGARFCGDCGAPLAPAAGSASSSLEPPVGLGEKKHITVLFADVVGSMDLQERLDPEAWAQIMGRFVAILAEGIRKFGGTVDKFTGDGIMALFGAPVAQEDHSRRACHAAWHLTRAIGEYSEQLRQQQGIELHVRLGLNSGEVVVGRVGDDVTLDPTALGHTVGLAQRMEALAAPGSACLTKATADLVAGYFELRDRGTRTVKGVHDDVAVFELVGPGRLRTALEVAAARGFSPFVGRDQEMATLEAAFDRACEGAGQLVGMVAGPGVGKSRLVHEFTQRCRSSGVDVFAAHALAHAQSAAYLPVLELLRDMFGITEADDPPAARAKVADAVRTLDPALQDTVTLLWDFLGVADPDRPAPQVDPEARQRQLFSALNRLGQARSRRGPVVYLVEDLHWLDPGSAAFLDNLINGIPTARILVVVTFRPEYHPAWAHRSYYAQIALQPLAGDAAQSLLAELLGSHPSVDGVGELIQARTGGNPFFIEEVVHGLVEDGSLRGRPGVYQLARTIDQIAIPATVQAVLAARIDRLAARDKAVLQAASVIGRHCSARLLGRVAGLTDGELRAALTALLDAELVHQSGGYPDEEYEFKHALTEEVAYGSQLTRSRTRTHIAAAQALAVLDADKLDERAALIAHHYEAGESLLDAARWNARAGSLQRGVLNHPVQAARHWRRVRALTDRLDQTPEAAELGINARLMLLSCHWRVGAASEEGPVAYEDEAATIFAEGETFADATGQPAVKVLFLSLYAVVRYIGYDAEDGYQYSLRATQLADQTGDPVLRVNARMPLVLSQYLLGRVRDAAAAAEEMTAIIGEDRSMAQGVVVPSPYGWCRLTRAMCAAHCGAMDRELIAMEHALDILGDEGDTESEGAGNSRWAILADLAGADPAAAAERARRGVEWAEQAGGPFGRIFTREGLAISHAQQGDWRNAIAVVDEALAIARERRISQTSIPLLLATRARAQLGLGDIAGARADAEEAVALAVRCGTGFYEVQSRHQLARALVADPSHGEEKAARAELDKAFALCATLGLQAYEPHLHEGLAELALAVGDRAAHDHQLRTAYRLFLDVGASGHARRLAAELSARTVWL